MTIGITTSELVLLILRMPNSYLCKFNKKNLFGNIKFNPFAVRTVILHTAIVSQKGNLE